MKDETLLDIAVSNYLTALKQFQYSTGDERELNPVGYFLQQAIELCIKHYLEVNGVRYPKTHAIEDLLDLCQRNGIPLKCSEQFYDFSPVFSKWESKLRCIKNYVLELRQVKRGFALAKEFLVQNGVSESSLKLKPIVFRDVNSF